MKTKFYSLVVKASKLGEHGQGSKEEYEEFLPTARPCGRESSPRHQGPQGKQRPQWVEGSSGEGGEESAQRPREGRMLLVINPSSRGQVRGFPEMGRSSR